MEIYVGFSYANLVGVFVNDTRDEDANEKMQIFRCIGKRLERVRSNFAEMRMGFYFELNSILFCFVIRVKRNRL